jgi:DNA repair protein RadC
MPPATTEPGTKPSKATRARKPSNVADAGDPTGATLRPISAWPVRERPRERLQAKGASALTDAELLAILIGHGTPGADAVSVGRTLITTAGSLGNLLSGEVELPHVAGVGPVKRARLVAALELARRAIGEGLENRPAIYCVEDTFDYLKAKLRHMKTEAICCIFLDARHKVISFDILAEGTIDGATLFPRQLVMACIRHHASAIILAHNHPSGDATPSREDALMTGTMRESLSMLDVELIDHVVVGAKEPVSMAEQGLI